MFEDFYFSFFFYFETTKKVENSLPNEYLELDKNVTNISKKPEQRPTFLVYWLQQQ